mgnify:CR=1 FL=1
MEFNSATQEILSKIDSLAKGKLNFREDLARLIDLSVKNNKLELLEDLSFHARYSQGLLKIVQNRDNNINDDYFAKVQSEFTESIVKIKSFIEILLGLSSEFIKEIFTEKYLAMNQLSLSNLNKLCSDLGYLKLYFNDAKRDNE